MAISGSFAPINAYAANANNNSGNNTTGAPLAAMSIDVIQQKSSSSENNNMVDGGEDDDNAIAVSEANETSSLSLLRRSRLNQQQIVEAGQMDQNLSSLKFDIEQNITLMRQEVTKAHSSCNNASVDLSKFDKLVSQTMPMYERVIDIVRKSSKLHQMSSHQKQEMANAAALQKINDAQLMNATNKEIAATLRSFSFFKFAKLAIDIEYFNMAGTMLLRVQNTVTDNEELLKECLEQIIIPIARTHDASSMSFFLNHASEKYIHLLVPYFDDIVLSVMLGNVNFIYILSRMYALERQRVIDALPKLMTLYRGTPNSRSMLLQLFIDISKTAPLALVPYLETLAHDFTTDRKVTVFSIFRQIAGKEPSTMAPYLKEMKKALETDITLAHYIPDIFGMVIRASGKKTQTGATADSATTNESGIEAELFDILMGYLMHHAHHQSTLNILTAVLNAVETRTDLFMKKPEYSKAIEELVNHLDPNIRSFVQRIKECVAGEKLAKKATKSANSKLKLKLQNGKEMRIINVEGDNSFQTLSDKIITACKLKKDAEIVITYKDADGDVLTVSNDDEFDEMMSFCESSKTLALKCELQQQQQQQQAAPVSVPAKVSSPLPNSGGNNSPFGNSSSSFTKSGSSSTSNSSSGSMGSGSGTGAPFMWKKGQLLGKGGFGSVYLGMDLQTGMFMAVKQIPLPQQNANGTSSNAKLEAEIKSIAAEIELMKKLEHKNIVMYKGTERRDKELNIFLEYVVGGSLSTILGKFGALPESLIRVYLTQILDGLHYLHVNNVIHRDIKAANILVDDKGTIKLADFGASKVIELRENDQEKHSLKGTPVFMAPEIIRMGHFSPASDIVCLKLTIFCQELFFVVDLFFC